MHNIKKNISIVLISIISLSLVQKLDAKKIPSEKPKLIVCLVIEKMKYNYIHQFWDDFGENGFKRIVTEGTYCKNARYNYLYTQSPVGYSTISTGTTPTYHGIVAEYWYDRLKEEEIYCTYDEKSSAIEGSYEYGQASPKLLLSTTIADELRIANEFRSKVFGVSLNPYSAILSTGHTTNAAYWYDFKKGNWISSSYYLDTLPHWVNNFNSKRLCDIYIERIWKPTNEINANNNTDTIDKGKNIFPIDNYKYFEYDISKIKTKQDKYTPLKYTPFGNTLTMDFSKTLIMDEKLGTDTHTDYISISLSANANIIDRYGQGTLELKDAYIRLDNEIENLVEFVKLTIGLENALFIITSDRGVAYEPEYLKSIKIPTGSFNTNQSIALLKSYLNIVYGKGRWIQFYHKSQIYLNRSLIEDSKIELGSFQNTVAQFMVQFNGVANAITANSLYTSNFSSGIYNKFQNSYNQNRSGDVLINLEPGWIENGDNESYSNSAYTYDSHVPLIWYGWKIKRRTISRPVNMIDIAPSISNLLEISNTNACIGNPIIELTE